MQDCTRNMERKREKAQILGKISRISKELHMLDSWKIGEDVKKVLVKEERGKKRSLDIKFYRILVKEKKKKIEKGLMSEEKEEDKGYAWRQFLVI